MKLTKAERVFLIALLCLAIATFGAGIWAGATIPSRESDAVDWVFKAPKPIQVYEYSHFLGNHSYILVNSEGGVYNTQGMRMVLPDTIK